MKSPHDLLPMAYRAAASVLKSQLLAEEAGERAVHQLTLAMLAGNPPQFPEAWLRVVARRSACALLKSEWARTQSVAADDIGEQQAPYRHPKPGTGAMVRERLEGALTPRQQQALSAAISCNTTRDAARSCGMKPRDFRRYLSAISRKAKDALAGVHDRSAFDDDASVQFELAT